ncbi:MAG: hypothetical protein Q9201_000774 [Fulgogasparrea decipioides]
MAVFCWTGARIGAFFPTRKDDGKGLRYRDVELVLRRIPDSGWKVMYRLDQRWVKNNRDPENIVYTPSLSPLVGIPTDKTLSLKYLLALALADNAIYGIESADDLWQLQIPLGDTELPLRWNDSALALPILRNATMDKGVTEEPLPKSAFDRILKSVLNLSGYYRPVTVYAIRRYLAKKVNGKGGL